MRAIAHLFMIALVGAGAAGCGEVKAKPDAGGNNGGSDAAMPDADMPPGCVADSYSCGADDALYQCDADGTALTKVQDCQYGCSVDHCRECAANTMFCSSDDLVTCDADGNIVNPQTCQHGCQMGACNTCDPGVAYCDNGSAVTCGLDGEPGASMACGAPGCQGGVCNSCTPSTTTCQGDKLVVCNASGAVQSTTNCALGCGTTPNAHCKVLVPSYGIPAPSGTLPSLVVDADATLDISSCSASPSSVDLTIGGTTMSIVGSPQVLVKSQSGGPPICIVRFGSITIGAGFTLTIVNEASLGHVLSLQAVGDVQVNGTISFKNNGPGPSPGGTVSTVGVNANSDNRAPGAGGGGGARAGGNGGSCVDCNGSTDFAGGTGGAAVTTISTILTGGSVGGDVVKGTSSLGGPGKGGGGLHLVSLSRVTIAATGRIALNAYGGGGPKSDLPAGGGGSGGTLVIETPNLSASDGAITVANGGGGSGGCYSCSNFVCTHHYGQAGQLSAIRAAGGDCPGLGDGGFEANGINIPTVNGADSDPAAASAAGGGGGGSNGFIFFRGRSAAAVMVAGGAIVSPQPTIGSVTAN